MQRIFLHCSGLVFTLLVAFSLGGGTVAEAKKQKSLNAELRGDYAVNGTLACVQNTDGFDTDLGLLSPAATRTIAVQGILNFDGFGTITFDGASLTVHHNRGGVGQFPLFESTFTCDGSYTVNPDGSFTLDGVVCNGTSLVGGVSSTFTITGILREGHIAKGRRTLLLNHIAPDIETVTFSDGSTFKRICNRAGTAVKIRKR